MLKPSALTRLHTRTLERAQAGLRRRVREVERADGVSVNIDGRALINFASNDYLGLAQDPRLIQAMQNAAHDWGVGATAAHLLGGHRHPHQELETELADWLGFERALLFTSGWQANSGLIGALVGEGDVCVQDKLNHASLLDAARLSGASLKRYRHADADSALQQLLGLDGSASETIKVLASDGVFSMDGDSAPFALLQAHCHATQTALVIDDAHGVGVLGDHGRGSWQAHLAPNQIDGLMITFGKALGTFGAAVLGSNDLIEGLIQFARPFVFTTATPPALAAATLASVRIVREAEDRRAHLRQLIARFRAQAAQLGLQVLDSHTPIQPVLMQDADQALQWSQALEAAGFYVPAIRPPTVPQARLRITLSAAHSEEQVDKLCSVLKQLHHHPSECPR